MKDRINQILQREQLTPSRFAEMLGVQPSSISHLLSGRNKPSFDFLEKVLLRFPNLNPDWVILGRGPMYRHASLDDAPSDDQRSDPHPQPKAERHVIANTEVKQSLPASDPKAATHEPIPSVTRMPGPTGKPIERVVVFFTDKTFAEYIPE